MALVMEYAAGGELLYRIRQQQWFPDTKARFCAAETADALKYVHNEARDRLDSNVRP